GQGRACAGYRGIAGEIDRCVDLIAGADDVTDVEEIVAGKEADAVLESIACFDLRLRSDGEPVAGLLAGIGDLGEDAARREGRCAEARCGRKPVDGNGLMAVAQRHLGYAGDVELAELLLSLHADLGAEELIFSREIVRRGKSGAPNAWNAGYDI